MIKFKFYKRILIHHYTYRVTISKRGKGGFGLFSPLSIYYILFFYRRHTMNEAKLFVRTYGQIVRVLGVIESEEETLLELEHQIVVTGTHYTTDVITTKDVTYYMVTGEHSDLPEEMKNLLENNTFQCNEVSSKDTKKQRVEKDVESTKKPEVEEIVKELDFYRKKLAETTVKLRNYKTGKIEDYSDNIWIMEATYRKQINYLRADMEDLKAENKVLKERYDKLREAYDILLDI
jgi:hypothetical protein